jgi:antibiotic biosynthesis monooxygenase (ABM) superfamily enzyme
MNDDPTVRPGAAAGSSPRYRLALMIWLAVLPTLIVLQLVLRGLLAGAPMVLHTLVLVTMAVPIVVYGLMPSTVRHR